jgi:hypothetical protein
MSSIYPSAIIVANNDLTDNVKNMLVKQLSIDEVLDGYTFDSFVDGYASYIDDAKKNNKRILVIRSYQDNFDRNLTDVNIFVKLGLAHVLHNKIGPHGITYRIVNLTWDKLCIYGDTRSIL